MNLTKIMKDTKQEYCVGFLFDATGTQVVLIKKTHPDWQRNRYNGPGGKIKKGETPMQAMERTFRKETGMIIGDWSPFTVLEGADSRVHFFSAHSVDMWRVSTQTDETLHI